MRGKQCNSTSAAYGASHEETQIKLWFKVPGSKAPFSGSVGDRAKAPPACTAWIFFCCFLLLVSEPQATFGSSKTQFQSFPIWTFHLKVHLLRVSQTKFEARKREQKTWTFSSHTPCSLLIAFLTAHTHDKGATRHQSYWPCDKCCQRSSK